MFRYQLDFEISKGNINTFLIGSKSLFVKYYELINLLANSVDIELKIEHKLIELENSKISYEMSIDIVYPKQNVLGQGLTKKQIDNWITLGLKKLFEKLSINDQIDAIEILASELGIVDYFLYVKISQNYLKKSLEDLEKLSILLFNNLVFFEM